MATKKLQELTVKELWKLYKNNLQFSNEVYEVAMEYADEEFTSEVRNLLGTRQNSYAFDQCYGVMRLRIRDEVQFVKDIDETYMATYWREATDLYAKAKKYIDEYEDLETPYSVNANQLWTKIEETVNALARELDNYFEQIQQRPDRHIDAVLESIADGASHMSDWEVQPNNIITYTITHCLK